MASVDFLREILDHKRALNQRKAVFYAQLRRNASGRSSTRYGVFKNQISRPGPVNLIAEIKKASPSKGLIRKDFQPLALARDFREAGAAAISVLTEDKFFLGRPEYLRKISEEVPLPLLAKDFIIDEGQILEAEYHGAAAVLLIMAILSDEQALRFLRLARSLDLDCLVEVHDRAELERALDAGAEIIGVNNRDLRTFAVDLAVAEDLIPRVPKDKVAVAESGIQTPGDVRRLEQAGARAVLIGETFMSSADVPAKIKEVMNG
jgi:indole-3-glycerol phosphate synthase